MDEPQEKAGLRNAWGRVAVPYDEMWAQRLLGFTERGLDLLRAPAGAHGLDVACGPGLSALALAERLAGGETLGVDFAPDMIDRAAERHAGTPGLSFAVDDAEHLSLPDGAFDVVTCSFGLMYCYDARAAVREMARVLRPGGRLALVVWGRAARVWWSPVIELIESRAEFYSGVCPMMFFYGLPGVLPRMLDEAGLSPAADEVITTPMRYGSVAEAAEAAIVAGPLSGLFAHRLGPEEQGEVRTRLSEHVRRCASPDGEGVALASEVAVVVAERPA